MCRRVVTAFSHKSCADKIIVCCGQGVLRQLEIVVFFVDMKTVKPLNGRSRWHAMFLSSSFLNIVERVGVIIEILLTAKGKSPRR